MFYTFHQGWEFALLLFCSFALSLFRSRWSWKKCDCEGFALVAPVSKSILSLFKKEQLWANHSHCSLQKSNLEGSALDFFKKERHQWFTLDSSVTISKNAWKKRIYHMFLTVFPPFYAFFAPVSLRSFFKINRINLLSSLFTKEQPWANRSRWSLKKSNGEQIDLADS